MTERSEQPFDRLTEIGNALLETLAREHDAADELQAIIMLREPRTGTAATCLSGFDDEVDAAIALFEHLAAIFEAKGTKLTLLPVSKPVGRG